MKNSKSVAVASRSFSKYPQLRAELEAKYEHVLYNKTGRTLAGPELVDFLRGHELAIIGLELVDEVLLTAVPELKIIGKYGVGLDKIDFNALKRHGVRMGWIAGVNKRSVSELALAFMLNLLRYIPTQSRELLSGQWPSVTGNLLTGKTIGIIGCGHVGKDLVEILSPFHCKILAHDIRDYHEFYLAHGVEAVGFEDLLKRSDVVTLHVPLEASTRNMIDDSKLSLMKKEALLINTARGGIVDEQALKARLKSGALRAAAFDVFAVEPAQDLELLNLPSFFSTPHIGGGAEEAALAMGRAAILGLAKHFSADELLKVL